MRKVIPVAEPWITDLERKYVAEAITDLTYIPRFEQAFAEYVGRRYAVSLPSCTSAIHLSLAALGIGKGDEVIVPDITWIGSSAPITYVGATPVFCDVDPHTWCIDIEALKIAITPRTKAIIAVDLYGGMPDYDKLIKLAIQHGIHVIEDAAEAVGSEYHGKKAGSFGGTSCFSFHGSKTLSCGEGGMLVTDNTTVYDRVLFLRDHGRTGTSFYNEEVAFKYKMSSVQTGLGLAQLERIEELVDKKRQIFKWYHDRLNNNPLVEQMNIEMNGCKNSYWMTTVVLRKEKNTNEVTQMLAKHNIHTRPFFYKLSSLLAYNEGFVALEKYYGTKQINGFNLPSGLMMTEEEVDYVCDRLEEILECC